MFDASRCSREERTMNFWVVEVDGKDPLPGGYYRNATKVAGPFTSRSAADPKLDELRRGLTDYDRNIRRVMYFTWSDDEIEKMRRIGTRI